MKCLRQKGKFRYYESGYPFEYYMVRFLYHMSGEFFAPEVAKTNPEDQTIWHDHKSSPSPRSAWPCSALRKAIF